MWGEHYRKYHEEVKMKGRYIYDTLYGPISFPDYIWNIFTCPELQRLREIRLCNINSLCLPGGANINRFEHAIGTCYLAQQCIKEWPALNPLFENEQKNLMTASLFHDTYSGPFGHSLEYLEDFDHEKGHMDVDKDKSESGFRWKNATLESIYFGLSNDLVKRVSQSDYIEIGKIVEGEGRLGKLLNSTMDLDNIDNVYRLAYHIGLVNSGSDPLKLAKSLWIDEGNLTIKKESVPLIYKWHEVRKNLYKLLLLNPEEFSAKCMLTDAIELSKRSFLHPFNWFDTDYSLINNMANIKIRKDQIQKDGLSNIETIQRISQRLMTGDLYGCAGIYSSSRYEYYKQLLHYESKLELEELINEKLKDSKEVSHLMKLGQKISITESNQKLPLQVRRPLVSIHPIFDVNKTERQIEIHVENGDIVTVGNRVDRLLIGIFFKNVNLNIYKTDSMSKNIKKKIDDDIKEVLIEVLGDRNVISLPQHGEINEIK